MLNPLADPETTPLAEQALVERAREGDRAALEELIRRHQPFIYNIALRMSGLPAQAEDVTQEILIKVITRLSTFRGQSSLRTWLYRIVANHVLTMRRQPLELVFSSFEEHASILAAVQDLEPPAAQSSGGNVLQVVEETKQSCLMGMLMCLDRSQRLAFILGGLFGVNDVVGGEVMEITPEAYRQKLSRARHQLANFMAGRCGLVDESNPCRCARKTRAAIAAGYVDPHNLAFNRDYVRRVRELWRASSVSCDSEALAVCQSCFADLPFHEPGDLVEQITSLLELERVKVLLDFS